jgi:carboxyl-terminal processing protease
MRFLAQPKPGASAPRLVVLVDRASAAGTEIIAAAIQDHGRGLIVGERTRGIGTVQTIVPLSDGSAVRLTTARFFGPKGRAIEGRGITPDVAIDQPGPASGPRSLPPSMAERVREDATLQQAIGLVKGASPPARP